MIALRHAAASESFGDDRVSDTEPEQFCILKVPQCVGLYRICLILVGLAVSSEEVVLSGTELQPQIGGGGASDGKVSAHVGNAGVAVLHQRAHRHEVQEFVGVEVRAASECEWQGIGEFRLHA